MLGQHISITTPDLRGISQPAAMDPDISATLSDFLTYTEHLPSAVIRSMTLIESLNHKAASLQKQIHDLLTTYSTLPTTMAAAGGAQVPDPVQMRRDISHAYEKLEECKRMSAAEAARIEDMVTRDGRRLHLVSQKLKALPKPPSRDPTPDTILDSPHLKRNAHAQLSAHRTTTAPRVRNRDKVMVPGEVLPPPNPDSPPASEPDDWQSLPPPSPREQRKSIARQKTPKAPRRPKATGEKVQKTPRQRPPGTPGTNAHSAVAGISTSNAIMALTKPPPDAVVGSKWLPWKRLTEFELAILRKRMKKNAAWRPSPAMRNRELRNLGRGLQAMDEARAEADRTGSLFVDEGDDAWQDPTQTSISGEQAAEMNAILGPEREQPDGDEALINRGMRLNEAKKLKRERQKAEELVHQAQPPDQINAAPQEHQTNSNLAKPKQDDKKLEHKNRSQAASKEDVSPIQGLDTQQDPKEDTQPAPQKTPARKKADGKKAAGVTEPELEKPDVAEVSENPQPLVGEASRPATRSSTPKPLRPRSPTQPLVESTTKKRKRDATPPPPPPLLVSADHVASSSDPPTAPLVVPEKKKLRLNPPAPPAHTSDPSSAVGTLAPASAPSPRISTRPRSQRTSIAPEQAPAPPTPSATRLSKDKPTIIIRRPKAASAEPSIRKSARRASNASLPGGGNEKSTESSATQSTPPEQADNGSSARPKRNKRPVPGVVAADDDGSAKVIIGKRKKPPTKRLLSNPQAKGSTKKEGTPAVSAAEEEIDPDEVRYCICGDVSWGTMIACDNEASVSFCAFPCNASQIFKCKTTDQVIV